MKGPRHDVIIALGARVLPGGRPGGALGRRIAHAASLYRDGRADWMVFCGGVGEHPPAEAEVMRACARELGVPDARILLEDRSADTLENAVNAAQILRARGWRRVLIVSDAFHLPRAIFLFRRLGFIAQGSAAPPHGHRGGKRRLISLGGWLREGTAWLWLVFCVLIRDRRRIAKVRMDGPGQGRGC